MATGRHMGAAHCAQPCPASLSPQPAQDNSGSATVHALATGETEAGSVVEEMCWVKPKWRHTHGASSPAQPCTLPEHPSGGDGDGAQVLW